MSDPIAEINDKLQKLIELRKVAEEEYGKLLTLVDQASSFPLPQEESSRLTEVKDRMNQIWDISQNANSGAASEDRQFWKQVAENTSRYIEPLVKQQSEFNSLVVHLINELVASLTKALTDIRHFHNTLVLYFQQIVPLVDTKNREIIGIEDKNIMVNLAPLQQMLIRDTKEQADYVYESLDKKIESLQVDNQEQQETLKSLRESVRSIQHLANSLSKMPAGKMRATAVEDYKYLHFEDYFRGSREDLQEKFQRYVGYFEKAGGTVIDLGCGRGEFLELLRNASIAGIGVDSNQQMVEECRKKGLTVQQGDLLEALQQQAENSLGGIFASQVIEHLPPAYLLRLLETAFTRLQTNAPLILETVNISTAFAFLQVYTKDLTHRTPVHPETLRFLLMSTGFQNPKILFLTPVPAVGQLKRMTDGASDITEVFNHNVEKLNKLLYDYQEYAAIGYK